MNPRTIFAALLPASLLLCTVPTLAASPATFDLLVHSKKMANSSFTVEKTKAGLRVRSSIKYLTESPTSNIANDYRIGNDGVLINAALDSLNNRSTTYFTPTKTKEGLDITSVVINVSSETRTIKLNPPDLIIAFPDDPSVWQVLLQVTAAHPHPDKIYRLLVPAAGKATDRTEPYRINDPTDATGSLDGKPVALKHYVLEFNAGKSDLYTDTDGNLMYASLALFNVVHSRTGFVLDK